MSIESCELIESVDDPSDALQYDAGSNVETWNDVLRLQREALICPRTIARCFVLNRWDSLPGPQLSGIARRYSFLITWWKSWLESR